MRYLLALLALLTVACSDDLTKPTLAPADTGEAWAYNPYYPNAPICPDNGTVNGAFMVRLHSWFAHNPTWLTISPISTGEQRKLQAEVYSYYGGSSICRNMHDLVNWVIQDPPEAGLKTEEEPFYTHYRIEQFRHIFGTGDGSDRVIASVGPRQTCCPAKAVSGVAADTVKIHMGGF